MTSPATPHAGGDLRDLLIHGLRDMLYAEARIHKRLAPMIDAARSPQLRDALALHHAETARQVQTLQDLFDSLGLHASSECCDAMEGILDEGATLLEQFAGRPAADAAIIFACQAIEHHEISRYRSLLEYARQLQLHTVAPVLERILAQEEAASGRLDAAARRGAEAAAGIAA